MAGTVRDSPKVGKSLPRLGHQEKAQGKTQDLIGLAQFTRLQKVLIINRFVGNERK